MVNASDSGSRSCAADQRLLFRYMDTKTLYFLNPEFQAASSSCDLFYNNVKFHNMGFFIGKSENSGFFRK